MGAMRGAENAKLAVDRLVFTNQERDARIYNTTTYNAGMTLNG